MPKKDNIIDYSKALIYKLVCTDLENGTIKTGAQTRMSTDTTIVFTALFVRMGDLTTVTRLELLARERYWIKRH